MALETVLILSNVTSGLFNFRLELLETLCKQFNVVVAASDNGKVDELRGVGCTILNIPISRHGTNPIIDLSLIKKYIDLEKKYKPIVALTYTIKPNIYGGIASQITKTPYITNITGLGDAIENKGVLSLIVRRLYKIALKSAERVFFQNYSNRDFFIDNNLYTGKYNDIPGSGVNLNKHCYEEYPLDDGNLILSVIGRITRDKGIEEIIKASQQLKGRNITIQLIGRCEGDYLDLIRSVEKDGVIRYVGQQEAIHNWIKNSHAVLHASYHEGMSNVLLEGAACGRPVIATNIPGCRETFDEGISGIGFTPKNTESMVRAIIRFSKLTNDERKQMGKYGRKKMEENFNRLIIVRNYLSLIESISNAR